MANAAFDLSETYVHLGLGSTTTELPGFSWSAEYLRGYLRRFVSDRAEGRLVGIVFAVETWRHWECHSGGDELVVQLSGSCDIVQEIDGEWHRVLLTAGRGLINPKGVWHTSDVHEPGRSLFVVGGRRTLYRRRDEAVRPAAGAPG